MEQEEIIKLAQEAGFENYAYEAVGVFERFARLVSAAEREKFTNTQEFVTLPREVVEQALKVLEYAANDVLTGRNAATALRAALEQPDHSEQSYMGCVTSDMHELAEWLNTMYEDSKEQIAALEQPQNHVPDVGNMVQAGWKPVPVEPTEAMLDAGCEAVDGPDWTGPNAVYRAMLAAAPQPPTTEDCSAVEQPQVEQEPVAYGLFRKDSSEIDWDADHVFSNEPWGVMYDDEEVRPLYTSPHPKREPLTRERIKAIQHELSDTVGCSYETMARAIEAAHNIK